MNPLTWLVVILAVIALGVGIAFAIASSLDFLFVGLAVVVALFATYFVGRLDKPDGDTGSDI